MKQELDGLQKAAVLLIALGPENSSNIFKHLKEEEIDRAQVLLLTFEKSLESIMMSLEAGFGKNRRNKYIKIKFEEV